MSTAQFLDLRNLDFDVPNALQKRPGTTFSIGSSNGTSGPITSLFEFVQLEGCSFVIAGSNTAMFYISAGALVLLSPGWTNGQPTDMLTFGGRLWMANGQKWESAQSAQCVSPLTPRPVGLPTAPAIAITLNNSNVANYLTNYAQLQNVQASNVSYMLVGGASHILRGVSWISRGVYVAYSYVRSDGFYGPADFFTIARNLVTQRSVANTTEFFASGNTLITFVDGFTIPSGFGISQIALWVGVDSVNIGSPVGVLPDGSQAQMGALGFIKSAGTAADHFMSYTMHPAPDLSRFQLFTLIPGASLFLVDVNGGGSSYPLLWGTTFVLGDFANFDREAPVGLGFSGVTSDFFASFIPKYQEINQNIMFISGFSSAPSTVNFSEVGQPEVFFPENTFEMRTNDGDRVYAIKAFNNTLIVAKEHSFSKLIGSNADEFQLVDLSTDFGCISNATILSKDQNLYWLDRKGILQYTGANWAIASDAVEQIFRQMNISAAKENAIGVHHMYRNQLWWGIPINGSLINNVTVVFDYLVGAWTFFDGFNPSSFSYIKGAQTKPTVWRGDYSGMIHYFGESFYSDSTRGITCSGFTRYENVGGENQTTLWRRFFLDVATASGLTGVINGQVYSNYDNTTINATFTMYQNQFQSRTEMGILGKAVAAQFSHSSASLPLLINGYSWASRGLRNV